MERMRVDRGRSKNPSKKRLREDPEELQPEPYEPELRFVVPKKWASPKPTLLKPTPLRKLKRDQLLASVMGEVTSEAKRKRPQEDHWEPSSKRREEPSSDEDEMEIQRGTSYPDDKVLLDMCFGGAARSPVVKRSTLLVTITTNKTAFAIHNQMDIERFKRDMTTIVNNVLTDKTFWVPKLNTEAWGVIDVNFSRPEGNKIIDGTKIKAEVKEMAWEEGTKYRRVHLHIMAGLTYQNFNGYFHVNKRALWEQIRYLVKDVDWGDRLPYINLRFIKNAMDSVAEYINKLHNQSEYETLAHRTLERINEYRETI